MATWTYFGGAAYTGTSGVVPFNFSTDNGADMDVTDFEADTTFEPGDSVTIFDTYLGSVTVSLVAGGTVELPVLTAGALSYIIGEAGVGIAAYNFPATLDLAALNATPLPACFLAGTKIATLDGEVRVEHLQIGDYVITRDGEASPVKWIGRQTVSTRFGPAERLMPVRLAAGALGPNVPHSDLTVTADHALLVDGVLCNAGALVNGTTIIRVPVGEMGETYTVYHVETDAHDIILANGAPAETFIDNVSRRAFDNYSEFETLYGDVPEMQELPLPRAMSARQIPRAIRQALANFRVA